MHAPPVLEAWNSASRLQVVARTTRHWLTGSRWPRVNRSYRCGVESAETWLRGTTVCLSLLGGWGERRAGTGRWPKAGCADTQAQTALRFKIDCTKTDGCRAHLPSSIKIREQRWKREEKIEKKALVTHRYALYSCLWFLMQKGIVQTYSTIVLLHLCLRSQGERSPAAATLCAEAFVVSACSLAMGSRHAGLVHHWRSTLLFLPVTSSSSSFHRGYTDAGNHIYNTHRDL